MLIARRAPLVLVVALSVIGCSGQDRSADRTTAAAAPEHEPPPAKDEPEASVDMSKQQAIEAATEFAANQGMDVDRYGAEARQDGDAWYVEFRPTTGKPSPGDFFTVVIDERADERLRLVHGK